VAAAGTFLLFGLRWGSGFGVGRPDSVLRLSFPYNTMTLKAQWRRAAQIVPPILLCLLAGCASRHGRVPAISSATSAPVTPPSAANTVDAPRPEASREVAVLYSSASGYVDVAAQLKKLLPPERYRLTLADVEAANSREIVAALRSKPGLFVVAIGLPAARIARDRLNAPIVFAQVFNYQELLVQGRVIRGVAAMPPLALQIKDWKKLDPKLQRLGLIVSESHADLITEAQVAAKSAAITIKHGISDSDRETLYLFKRLAPQIDGLWLIPDDRILSPTVLRELLSYALSHGVRVCVFSDALLPWGALLSASPTPRDIARTVRRVLEDMMAGNTAAPALAPLSELSVRLNEGVASRLGLPSQPRPSWIVGGER
jgi:ABC-type uncharacterized transport system substrate-binding protein